MEMAENGVLKPEKMAPTDRAAHYHGLRAHLQIVKWKLLDSNEIQLSPREWRWQCKNGGKLSCITTDREVTPENILKVMEQTIVSAGKMNCLASQHVGNAMVRNVKINR